MSTVQRTGIFIAYSYPEKRWLDRVLAALQPVAGDEPVVVWDDRKLLTGHAWKGELADTLARSKVAMMIVSDPFLLSGFVTRAKLPTLLDREREQGLRICWVLAGYCLFSVAGLRTEEAGNGINAALDGLSSAGRDAVLADVARKVALLLGAPVPEPAPLPTNTEAQPEPAPTLEAPTSEVSASEAPALEAPEVKPPPRKRKRATAPKAEKPVELPLALEPEPPAPLLQPPPPQPQLQFPAPKPQTHLLPPVPEPEPEPAPEAAAAMAPPAPDEPPPRRADSPLLPALDSVIDTRQETIGQLCRLARWMRFAALGLAVLSLPAALTAGLTHFLLIFGFALFLASLTLFLHARIALLSQRLVGLRYTRSGLADELLPNRQREPLLRRVAEILG